jgi:hypothetical protein
MAKTVNEILTEYLESNGFDGLVNLDMECGCKLGDLAPCCNDITSCQPAYRHCRPDGSWAMFIHNEPPTQYEWVEMVDS